MALSTKATPEDLEDFLRSCFGKDYQRISRIHDLVRTQSPEVLDFLLKHGTPSGSFFRSFLRLNQFQKDELLKIDFPKGHLITASRMDMFQRGELKSEVICYICNLSVTRKKNDILHECTGREGCKIGVHASCYTGKDVRQFSCEEHMPLKLKTLSEVCAICDQHYYKADESDSDAESNLDVFYPCDCGFDNEHGI
jgi:hypothetical protein